MAVIPRFQADGRIADLGSGALLDASGQLPGRALAQAGAQLGDQAVRWGAELAARGEVQRFQQAQTQAQATFNDLDAAVRSAPDLPPEQWAQTFRERAFEARDRILGTMPDGEDRDRLSFAFDNLIEAKRASLLSAGRSQQLADADTANVSLWDSALNGAVAAGNPAEAQEFLAQYEDATIEAVGAGLLREPEAQARIARLQNQYQAARLSRLVDENPRAALAALGRGEGAPRVRQDFRDALKARESGGDPSAVNAEGYVGLYQFGEAAAAAAGFYEPDGDPNDNQWNGRFVGLDGVATLADFLASPAAQERAFDLHVANLRGEITARGLDRFIGSEVGGVPVTESGLVAAMHLGGPAGTAAFLASGGKSNPADANGTRIGDYLRTFAGADGTGVRTLSRNQPEGAAFEAAKRERDRAAARRIAADPGITARGDVDSLERAKALADGIAAGEVTIDEVNAARGQVGEALWSRLWLEADGRRRDQEQAAALDASARLKLESQARSALRSQETARLTTALGDAIETGRAGWQDLNQARGLLPEDTYRRLRGELEKRDAKAAERSLQLDRVSAAVAGTRPPLDPGSAEDRKAVDVWWEAVAAPAIAALPEERQAGALATQLASLPSLPSPVAGLFRSAVRGEDPAALAQAAGLYDRVQAVAPVVLRDLQSDDAADLAATAALTRAGLPAEQAAARVIARRQYSADELQRLDGALRAVTSKRGTAAADWLATKSRGGWFGRDAAVPAEMVSAFETLQRDHWYRTRDLGAAREAAWSELQRVWAVTDVGGPRRWMAFAPEAFGPTGLTPAENSAWMNEQLLADARAVDPAVTAERVTIRPDQFSRFEAAEFGSAAAAPAYQVWVRNDEGVSLPLLAEDGTIRRWRPDWSASPAAQRLERARRAAAEGGLAAGRAERQRLQAGGALSDQERAAEEVYRRRFGIE